jgi:hypothetical protein
MFCEIFSRDQKSNLLRLDVHDDMLLIYDGKHAFEFELVMEPEL